MQRFTIEVECHGGGARHKHSVLVEYGSVSFGVSSPGRVRLQYTCPRSGEAFLANFAPPAGAGRPFTVAQVD